MGKVVVKFSILISLYYKEKPAYLEMCLDSLVSQTLPASEIVVVFDGIIPGDLERIVQHFTEKLPLVVVSLPQNVGLGRP
ncbi:hypothetical protein Mh1949_08350 [Mannheimia haemolytica]|nr:glycosyltransferase [Mannheimia haemolytica]